MTYERFKELCPEGSRIERVGPLMRVDSRQWGQKGTVYSYPSLKLHLPDPRVIVKIDGRMGTITSNYREWQPLTEEPKPSPASENAGINPISDYNDPSPSTPNMLDNMGIEPGKDY